MNITNHIRAGYPGLYIVSHEEQRVEAELTAVAKTVKFDLYGWSITNGICRAKDGMQTPDTEDPLAMLKKFDTMADKTILLARDFHMLLAEPNPVVYRQLKDSLLSAKSHNRVFVIVGCQLKLPPELEKYISVMDFQLPDRKQLREVMHAVAEAAEVEINADIEDTFIDAASGLTTIEAENAFALSIIEMKEIVASVVQREKANTIRKNGLLEIIGQSTTLDDIGGLELLKADLVEKRLLFTKKAREYGLTTPRGILAVGQPGSGKSLLASATAGIFNIPLIRLEAGKLFGSLVGQSEANWRNAFATVKAVSPCVLWIDEVDGLFAGAQSSGQTDSGVTARVIKAILQDMQFNSEGIFYVFTANDIDGLPDPLIDRLDVWSVDLANQTERETIWRIHIAKLRAEQPKAFNPAKFDIPRLAKATDGFSGRQIEQVWLKAMNLAFNNKGREPKDADVIEATTRFVPTSVTMRDAIERRRLRLKDRATPASAPEGKTTTGRKLAVK